MLITPLQCSTVSWFYRNDANKMKWVLGLTRAPSTYLNAFWRLSERMTMSPSPGSSRATRPATRTATTSGSSPCRSSPSRATWACRRSSTSPSCSPASSRSGPMASADTRPTATQLSASSATYHGMNFSSRCSTSVLKLYRIRVSKCYRIKYIPDV